MVSGSALAALALASAVAMTACFAGYDSRWGQAKAAQQRLAARSTPQRIGAEPVEAPSRAERQTYHLRLRPNPHYLAQTIDAERQLRDLVDDADRVLASSLALHLEVDEVKPWSFAADETLDGALVALQKDDPGRGVDVVVGLIGALPRQTDALHEVGYAEVLGHHLVLRAAGRLGEHDSVDQALTELSAEERDRVVRSRRQHRATAILLHELGHVLGALHETARDSLMHPAYDPKMDHYGAYSLALMRVALDAKDHASLAKSQLDLLRATKEDPWVPGERDAAMTRLAGMVAPAQQKPASPAPPPSAEPATPPELQGDDREQYARALDAFRAGSVAPAYALGRPLFSRYPSSRAVQDFRCQLATVRWLAKDALVAECAGVTRLSDAGASDTRQP